MIYRTPMQLFHGSRRRQLWDPLGGPASPHVFDFRSDAQQWQAIQGDATLVRYLRGILSNFYVGEDGVAASVSAIRDAAATMGDRDARAFLASQIQDEENHRISLEMVCDQVFGFKADAAELVAASPEEFRRIFGVLDEKLASLRNPQIDQAAFVRAVTTYHLVVESFLAVNTLKMLTGFLRKIGKFPGIIDVLNRIERDESRHVAWGQGTLCKHVSERPEMAAEITDQLVSLAAHIVNLTAELPAVLNVGAVAASATAQFDGLIANLRDIGIGDAGIGAVDAAFKAAAG
jgi:ribonucleotide reductase beta subunit family protein with ferritin-like domain